MLKKLISLSLIIFLALFFAGCGATLIEKEQAIKEICNNSVDNVSLREGKVSILGSSLKVKCK